MAKLWTIGELASAAQKALANGAYPKQRSGRVRDVPDARTIRYYTTLGLVDRPAEMRGRTAFYGRRHLLQLVAIKRLQARGKPLVEIQAELTGAGDAALEDLSALPEGFWESVEEQRERASEMPARVSGPSESAADRREFWATTPQATTTRAESPPQAAAKVARALHLNVLDDVTLVLEGVGERDLDAERLAKLRPALDHLRRALEQTGLMKAKGSGDDANS